MNTVGHLTFTERERESPEIYHSSPSFSLPGTSITLGLSMIRAVRLPFSTMPMIQDWYPSCFSMSLQYAAACSLGRQMSRPPEVSAEWPWRSWNMLPQALATAAILAMTGRLWMTKATSFFWLRARAWAWPRRPKPTNAHKKLANAPIFVINFSSYP